MPRLIANTRSLLSRIQKRFEMARPGSVMILVVGLLVLMALIGTAFITTARTDRYSVQQHAANTQVDLLLTGVENVIQSRIAQENFLDPSGKRYDAVGVRLKVPSDASVKLQANWLASRVPVPMFDACGIWDVRSTYQQGDWVFFGGAFYVSQIDGNFNHQPDKGTPWLKDPAATPQTPVWEGISCLFDGQPGVTKSAQDVRAVQASGDPPVSTPQAFDGHRGRNLVQLVYSTGASTEGGAVQVNGTFYPALRFYNAGDPNANPPIPDGIQVTLAASATGNGIPDSFLWRLPIGELNGVTYFAAVRVIDNNSAINLNTAGSLLYDFDGNGNALPNLGFFPGNIGIAEMLWGFNPSGAVVDTGFGNEFSYLNLYRTLGLIPDSTHSNAPIPSPSNMPRPDGIIIGNNAGGTADARTPIGDYNRYPIQRGDLRYLGLADADFMGIGRRLDVPSYSMLASEASSYRPLTLLPPPATLPPLPVSPRDLFNNPFTISPSNPVFQFHDFSWSDSAALAYRGDLVNPTAVSSGTVQPGASIAERVLQNSLALGTSYRTGAWDPGNAQWNINTPQYTRSWFNQNYAYQFPAVIGNVFLQSDPTTGNSIFNLRPLVVARNPVSNLMPIHVPEMDLLGSSNSGNVSFGGTWGLNVQAAMGYMDIGANASYVPGSAAFSGRGNMPRVALNTAGVIYTPLFNTTNTAPIVSTEDARFANTSLFNNPNTRALIQSHVPSLWMGFYNAMLPALEAPYSVPPANQPFAFLTFPNTSNNGQALSETSFTDPNTHNLLVPGQFRSSLRDPAGVLPTTATTFLPPNSQLLLRSLLAAVNAKDLRDSDDDVTSVTIQGFPVVIGGKYYGPGGGANLTVFGAERQPFITEVYVNNDASIQSGSNPITSGKNNPAGYVAVELYNPYDRDISLVGWGLGTLHRAASTGAKTPTTFYYPSMGAKPISAGLDSFAPRTDGSVPVVRAHSFLVLENVDINGATNTFRPWWIYAGSPFAGNTNLVQSDRADLTHYYYVPQLETVLGDGAAVNQQPLPDNSGDELVLLRPRRLNTPSFDQYGIGTNPANVPTSANYDPRGYDERSNTNGGTRPAGTTPTSYLTDMMPVDSFDFFNIRKAADLLAGPFQAWHYVRANAIFNDTGITTRTPPDTNPAPRPSWKFVYRGHWSPLNPVAREEGVATSGLWGGGLTATTDPWIGQPPGFSATPTTTAPVDGLMTAPINLNGFDYASSYPNPYPPNPINNTGYGDPTPATPGPATNQHGINKEFTNEINGAFPFGGFARSGDVLSAPFIGAYTITYFDTGRGRMAVAEMNPITADAGFADDNVNATLPNQRPTLGIATEDNEELIGRFAPLSSIDSNVNNFMPVGLVPPSGDNRIADFYGWASQVLDYFSAIQTPVDDYLPNSKPEDYLAYDPSNPTVNAIAPFDFLPMPTPFAVPNNRAGTSAANTGIASPDGSPEAFVPIDGQININTAPWRVLAQVPWVSALTIPSAASSDVPNRRLMNANLQIAQAIVRYRNQFGPFRSLFELNRVYDSFQFSPADAGYTAGMESAFQGMPQNPNSAGIIGFSGSGAQPIDGNGAPDATDYLAMNGVLGPSLPGYMNDATGWHVRDGLFTDYNQRFAELTKVSNLLTTRSDSFTIYIQIQGWRGVGGASPEMVVQRRAAYILDRSGATRSIDAAGNSSYLTPASIPTKIQTQ